MKEGKLTKFELEVMEVLWELKSASVTEIREALPRREAPAYTTVQTIVRRLEEAGAVRVVGKIGNAYIFAPTIKRVSAIRRLVNELLDLFGGSAQPLMAHLVETRKLSLDDLRAVEKMLKDEATQSHKAAPKSHKRR